jgi:hypothetical protein
MNEQSVEQDLRAISGKRIYFGHQSVGENILEGIGDLVRAGKDAHLNMVEIGKQSIPAGPFFAESRIGRNGDPDSKCKSFTGKVGDLAADSLDLAVMKFCYVDFTKDTDVKSLFALYRATIDSLRAKAPGVRFVHVTAPLTVPAPGWKKLLKRALGRPETSVMDNAKRNEYNDLLRQSFKGEPMFDLAAVESTFPDGSRKEISYEGKTVYTLIGELSDDGAHLNRKGRDRAAKEFVHVLAAVSTPASR